MIHHIMHKGVVGSGKVVVDHIADHKIEVGPWTFGTLLDATVQGDCLVFHGRTALLNCLPFLVWNKMAMTRRNRICYNPHTNLRPKLLHRIFLNMFVDKIISFTNANKEQLDKAGFRNVVVIPNPIPVQRLKEAKASIGVNKEYDFVWVGRNNSIKRLEIFIRMFLRITNIKGVILADVITDDQRAMMSPVNDRLRALAGLNGSAFFSEFVKGKVLVFTSTDAEGFPITLLEAMYLGIPIIAPGTPKFREILQDEALYFQDEEDLARLIVGIKNGSVAPVQAKRLLEVYSVERVKGMYGEL